MTVILESQEVIKVKPMAKTTETTHNTLKFFGIKIFDYYSDYICNETIENIETLRDDIILHENSIRNRGGRNE